MQNVTWNANSQLELPGSAKSRTEQLIDLRACPGALRALDLQRLWNILGLSAFCVNLEGSGVLNTQ